MSSDARPVIARRQRAPSPAPWLALLLFVVLAVLLTLPVWMSPLTQMVGGGADSRQTMWFLGWVPFALTHHHNPLLSNYMNYPSGFNMLWNTSIPAAGFLLWPITTIWGVVATYNVVMTASMVLAAWFAFFAVRRYVLNPLAAVAGALVYGFSPYVVAQLIGHTHLVVSSITPPLVLILVDELVRRQKQRAWPLGILLAGVGTLQFLLAEEVFTSEVLIATLLIVVLAVSFPRRVRERAGYVWRTLRVAVPLAAVLLAYPLYLVLLGPNRITSPLHSAEVFTTDLLNPFVPTLLQAIAPQQAVAVSNSFTGNASEWNGYLGIPLVAVLLFVVVRYRRNAVARTAALMTLLITILALGPDLHIGGHATGIPLPWWLPAHLPLLEQILPSRLMIYAFLSAGIGFAFLLSRLLAHSRTRPFAVLVAAAVFSALVPAVPLIHSDISTPAYFTSAATQDLPDGIVAATVPWGSVAEPDPLLWQIGSGYRFRNISGYFLGPPATSTAALKNAIDAVDAGMPPVLHSPTRTALLDELKSNHVAAVIAGPSPHQADAVAFFSDLLSARPVTHEGVDLWLAANVPALSG